MREKIYSSISECLKEIDLRSNFFSDKELVKFWSENLPPFTTKKGKKYGVLSRHLFTPNNELRYFLDICESFDLEPVLLEYSTGKFVTVNRDKYRLGKLLFLENENKTEFKIFDIKKYEGKNLSEIKTFEGKGLIDFHHNLLKSSGLNKNIINFCEWFDKTKKIDGYYTFFFSLFLKNAILFENFLFEDKREEEFFKEKILPSFNKIEEKFGIKPLICPLLPINNEKSDYWMGYSRIKNSMKKKLKMYNNTINK